MRSARLPHATCIQTGDVGIVKKPRSTNDRDMRGPRQRAAGARTTGSTIWSAPSSATLGAQHQPTIRVDVAQAREAIHDETQAPLAFEGVVPAVRLIAVQGVEHFSGSRRRASSNSRAHCLARPKSHCGAKPACSMHTFSV